MSCCETKICKQCPVVQFTRTHSNAVIPSKGTNMSIGYDLTAVEVYKKLSEKTTLFNTGIKVVPPEGYYTEILPRSSLSKTGYMLSNSVGVIDPDFSDNLLIALTKIDDSMPDIQLPFTRCQLVLRKCDFFNMKEVSNITDTGRGSFGSTDIKNRYTGRNVVDVQRELQSKGFSTIVRKYNERDLPSISFAVANQIIIYTKENDDNTVEFCGY
jgi:hypothetical protein